jgi:ABC-type transport system involved in multi-copper enzyme maturation permease subunit
MGNPLCRYSKIFGEPGSHAGARKYRIFGIAIFDVLVVLLAAYLISIVCKQKLLYVSIGLFLLGIVVHRVFCVRTAVDKMLFYGGHRSLGCAMRTPGYVSSP